MRVIALLMLCIIVTGCGGGGTSAPAPIQPSSIPSVPAPPPAAPQPIVFTGDSVTAHWTNLTTLVPNSANVAIGGAESAALLERFERDVLSLHPSVVVIEAGINDVADLPDPNIDSIARMAELASASGARVIICSLLITPKYEVRDFNARLLALTQGFGYAYLDYYTALSLPDGTQDPALFLWDLVHPDDAGYAAMWSVLQPALASAENR